jgi:asparagine synthase (glutamine-hydrolysing)
VCGIVGIAGRGSGAIESLCEASSALAHRGPDSDGEWWSDDRCVGLAHRRLAVIDLSPGGQQPMVDAASGHAIAYNGEIYNFEALRKQLCSVGHSFRSQSDTEVVLKAYAEWGMDCLQRLNGMFAFALYDSRRRQLLLARDRAGEKPLFYRVTAGQLTFASELKAMLAAPGERPTFDREALDCYLSMGYVPGSRCIVEGFRKLPPAHALVYDIVSGETRTWAYWELPACPSMDNVDPAPLTETLEKLLEDSVRRQLVADVPVGIMLSGGVDSSLITALAARARTNVKTFSVRFPGHGALDETEHARRVATAFSTDHVELSAAEADPALLTRLARQIDEPIIDSSMVPTYLVSETVRRHCTVALGGDGGDELFGGYREYTRLHWLRRHFGLWPRPLRRAVAGMATRCLPTGYKGRNWLAALGADLERGLPLLASYFDPHQRRALLPDAGLPLSAESIYAGRVPDCEDLIERATRMDFGNYLPEDLLVKVDRSSMMTSLEVRCPFLDVDVTEFAFGCVPAHLKAGALGRKVLLKRVAARVLPIDFDLSRKQGFDIPINDWVTRGPWRAFFREVLLDSGCLFRAGPIERALRGLERGHNNGERLFGLLMMELWRREYGVCL